MSAAPDAEETYRHRWVIEFDHDPAAEGTNVMGQIRFALENTGFINVSAMPFSVIQRNLDARYICKQCGAESPAGIGYVLHTGETPPRSVPDPECPNRHLPTPGLGDELFPDGRNVWYEGDDPEGFLSAVRERWGVELTLKEDPSGFAFFCPPGYVQAIYGSDEWPMGS